jgi:hypothetical protein
METMSTHLSDGQLDALRGRTLRAEDLIEASRHLQSCDECRARAVPRVVASAAARMLHANLAAREPAPHLDFEEALVPLAEGRLDGEARARAEAHLAECAACRAELDDLIHFRGEVATWTPQPRPHARLWAVFAAAAAIAIAFFLMRREPPAPHSVPGPVHVQPPAMLVELRDGDRRVGVDATGALHGTSLQGEWAAMLAHALRAPYLAQPSSLQALAASRDAQRGSTALASHSIAVIEPLGIVVESDRPHFRWRASGDLARFEIAVLDAAGRVIARGTTNEHEWQPATALPRGGTYAWQVRAKTGSEEIVAPPPDEAEARFGVLAADIVDAIVAARGRGEGHVVVGLLYFRGGAIAEARREFEIVAAENPASPIAQRLLASTKHR